MLLMLLCTDIENATLPFYEKRVLQCTWVSPVHEHGLCTFSTRVTWTKRIRRTSREGRENTC